MLICMRTTVVLDDGLVMAAKKRAAESRTTLSAVINEALRDALNSSPARSGIRDYTMLSFGGKPCGECYEPSHLKAFQYEPDND